MHNSSEVLFLDRHILSVCRSLISTVAPVGFRHRHYRVAHAALLYVMRPNRVAQQIMKQRLEQIIPRELSHNGRQTGQSVPMSIGIPIRGEQTSVWLYSDFTEGKAIDLLHFLPNPRDFAIRCFCVRVIVTMARSHNNCFIDLLLNFVF